MHKIFTALFLSAALTSVATGQQNKGQIRFEKQYYDFGTFNELDGEQTGEFKFNNYSQYPVVIKEVKAGCGCTTPSWTTDTIHPGDSGVIKAAYNPAGRPGPFEKAIFVYTDGIPYQYFLTISGTVTERPKTKDDMFPSSMGKLRMTTNYFDFGFVYQDETDTVEQIIYNASKDTVRITGISERPPFIQVVMPTFVIAPKQQVPVYFIYDAKASREIGEIMYYMNMETDDPGMPQKAMHAHVNLVERFPKMSAKQLKKAPKAAYEITEKNFGKVLQGDSVVMYYKVTNTGKQALKIRKLVTTCGCTAGTAGKMELKQGESTEIKVVFKTAGREGDEEKSVSVITNDPETPVKKLMFKGQVVTNPNAVDKKF